MLKLSAIMRSDAPNLAITQPKSNDNPQKSILHLYQRATEIKHRKKEKEKSKPLADTNCNELNWKSGLWIYNCQMNLRTLKLQLKC